MIEQEDFCKEGMSKTPQTRPQILFCSVQRENTETLQVIPISLSNYELYKLE